LNVEGVNGEVS